MHSIVLTGESALMLRAVAHAVRAAAAAQTAARNFTCGEDGKTLLVDAGERGKLVALQSLTLPKNVAKSE